MWNSTSNKSLATNTSKEKIDGHHVFVYCSVIQFIFVETINLVPVYTLHAFCYNDFIVIQ